MSSAIYAPVLNFFLQGLYFIPVLLNSPAAFVTAEYFIYIESQGRGIHVTLFLWYFSFYHLCLSLPSQNSVPDPLFLFSCSHKYKISFSITGFSLAWQNLQDAFLWPKRSRSVTVSTPLSFWCFSFSSTSIFKGVLSSLNSITTCPYSNNTFLY